MDIYIYSDESGVFDYVHNDIFVFGGVIFLSKEDKDIESRRFARVEKSLRKCGDHDEKEELKASKISPKEKTKMFRSLNPVIKFGAVIKQKRINKNIFNDKKSKQRYLDYAYKIALKRAFEELIDQDMIRPEEVECLHIYIDEHTTATNGRYELRESLEREFKIGTFNWNYMVYFPPIFPNITTIDLHFCDSTSVRLVRAADIVANQIHYHATRRKRDLYSKENMYIANLP